MSRLVISPVSNSLNGTVMNCVDVADSGEVSSTTIIVGGRGALQGIIIVYVCYIPDNVLIPATQWTC